MATTLNRISLRLLVMTLIMLVISAAAGRYILPLMVGITTEMNRPLPQLTQWMIGVAPWTLWLAGFLSGCLIAKEFLPFPRLRLGTNLAAWLLATAWVLLTGAAFLLAIAEIYNPAELG